MRAGNFPVTGPTIPSIEEKRLFFHVATSQTPSAP